MTIAARGDRIAAPLWVLATLALLAFVKLAAELLIPIVLSALAALALEPVVAWLTRRRVPRGLAAALVLLVVLGAATVAGYALRDHVASAFDALPTLARRIRAVVASALDATSIDEASRALQGSGEGAAAQSATPALSAAAGRLGTVLLAATGHATVIVFLVFFLLQSGPRMTARLLDVAGSPARRATVATVLADINGQVQRFLLVTAVTAVIVAIATWIVLAWMGVANAALWAACAGLLNSIPYFGPVAVSGGMFVVGLVQQGTAQAWQMSAAALAITAIEGWLITPPLMGRAERMNVLAVFFGLLLWTWLWGAWGTLLAVPMLSVVKSVADHVTPLKRVGRLLAA